MNTSIYEEYQRNIKAAGHLRAQMIYADSVEQCLDLALSVISAMVGEDCSERILRARFGLEKGAGDNAHKK